MLLPKEGGAGTGGGDCVQGILLGILLDSLLDDSGMDDGGIGGMDVPPRGDDIVIGDGVVLVLVLVDMIV